MGPERKDQLAASDQTERKRQELEALILESKRLVEEMQRLTARAKLLAAQQVSIVEAIKSARAKK